MRFAAGNQGVEVQLVSGLLVRSPAPLHIEAAWQDVASGLAITARRPPAPWVGVPLAAGERVKVGRHTVTLVSELGQLAVYAVAMEQQGEARPEGVLQLVQPELRQGCADVLREAVELYGVGDLAAVAVLGLLTGRRTLVRISADTGLESAALAGLGASLSQRLGHF